METLAKLQHGRNWCPCFVLQPEEFLEYLVFENQVFQKFRFMNSPAALTPRQQQRSPDYWRAQTWWGKKENNLRTMMCRTLRCQRGKEEKRTELARVTPPLLTSSVRDLHLKLEQAECIMNILKFDINALRENLLRQKHKAHEQMLYKHQIIWGLL